MGVLDRLFGVVIMEVVGLGMYLAIIRRGAFDALLANGVTVDEVVSTLVKYPDVLLVAIVLAAIVLFGDSSSSSRHHHQDHTDADDEGLFDGDGGDGGGLFDGDGGGGFGGDGGGGGGGE